MALNQTDLTLQKLSVSLTQLVQQLQVTQSSKSEVKIEDIIKALNLTFKTTKGDTTELKSLLKIAKNAPNSVQYEKLNKMLELLLKSYDNPDVKQMQRLGITAQNILAELGSFKEEISNTNIRGNEKANLSLLSKAVAEGQRQYAVNGFGRNASGFYKKATLEQLLLLKAINKHIDAGIPLKGLKGKGVGDKIEEGGKKMLSNGPILAAADMLMKGMGFGTLPGEFLDMFKSKGKGDEKDRKLTKKEQRQALRVEETVSAKEKSQQSLDANKMIQNRAVEVKTMAEATKNNLTVELSKSIADAMRIGDNIDEKYADENNPGNADVSKIQEAIKNNQLSKEDLASIMAAAYPANGTQSSDETKAMTDAMIKNLDEVQEYTSIINEQNNTIKETAIGIQTSIETISGLFLDLREILGKELKAELNELNHLFKSREFRGMSKEEKDRLKTETVNRKLNAVANRSNVEADELHGLIGGEDSSNYMKEYKLQGESFGGVKGESEIARKAFEENTFREALFGKKDESNKPISTPGEEFESKVRETQNRLANAPIKPPADLTIKPVEPPPVESNRPVIEEGEGISFDEMADIMNESITEFLQNFDEAMKTRDKESRDQMEILKKSLLSGEVKVKVTNLKDIPSSGGHGGGNGGGGEGAPKPKYGDEGAALI